MTPAARVVPHEHDAVLLDRLWALDAATTCAVATVRPGSPFGEPGDGWPDWMLIELMAQVVAGGAGLREFSLGTRPRLGLLLGVRNFTCSLPQVTAGSELRIEAAESSRDENGMGVFDCSVSLGGQQIAGATLSVYLPASVKDYLESLEP